MGPLRFVQVLFLCVVFMVVELNTFFLKFCLWIPPRNPLVTYRLIMWWLIAIPTIREYNSYLQDRSSSKLSSGCSLPHICWQQSTRTIGLYFWTSSWYLAIILILSKPVKKVGAFCWLSLATCIVELLVCMKFGRGELSLFTFLVKIWNKALIVHFMMCHISHYMFCKYLCLTFSILNRPVSWANAYLVDHLLELGGDSPRDFPACMVMEESPKIPEKAALIVWLRDRDCLLSIFPARFFSSFCIGTVHMCDVLPPLSQ
jgi:hypothetical protein